MGHKKGKRKREKELRERVIVDKALGIRHKGFCPHCGKRLVRLNSADLYALESGKCPLCGSGLRVTDDGILFCSKRPLCKWNIYFEGLDRFRR